MAMRLYLARHGETEWNVVHRLQGRSDTMLTARGVEHGRALATLLRSVPLDAIYTSTLRRTVDTARPTAEAHGLASQARAALDEISYGVLEGRLATDPEPQFRRLWAARKADPLHFAAPGGESYPALMDRVAPFVAELWTRHAAGTVLVVGHRATNRALLAQLLGLPLAEVLAFKHKHDVVVEIRPGMEPARIEHRYASLAAQDARAERGLE
jgi:broad specificity phosphatase PhoE